MLICLKTHCASITIATSDSPRDAQFSSGNLQEHFFKSHIFVVPVVNLSPIPEQIKTFFLSVGPKHLCRQMQISLRQHSCDPISVFIESRILDEDIMLRFSCFYLIWMRKRRSGWADGEGKKAHTSYTITDNDKMDRRHRTGASCFPENDIKMQL